MLYYPLDMDEAERIRDQSGHGNDGLVHGATYTPQGQIGGAYRFDGVNSFVSLGNSAKLALATSPMTVTAWVKFDSYLASIPISARRFNGFGRDLSIVSKMVATNIAGGPNRDGWRLVKQADGHFWFCLGQPDNGCQPGCPTTVRSTTLARPNTWYHLAAIKSAKTMEIYVNGVLEEVKPLG